MQNHALVGCEGCWELALLSGGDTIERIFGPLACLPLEATSQTYACALSIWAKSITNRFCPLTYGKVTGMPLSKQLIQQLTRQYMLPSLDGDGRRLCERVARRQLNSKDDILADLYRPFCLIDNIKLRIIDRLKRLQLYCPGFHRLFVKGFTDICLEARDMASNDRSEFIARFSDTFLLSPHAEANHHLKQEKVGSSLVLSGIRAEICFE
mmetsp:Transcript_168190/g.322965  ORF Transcript_168190/g.322965 Transcript_168190/m.322965 type:complete len:210 (-) Transcript_168190:1340-1969(-)